MGIGPEIKLYVLRGTCKGKHVSHKDDQRIEKGGFISLDLLPLKYRSQNNPTQTIKIPK